MSTQRPQYFVWLLPLFALIGGCGEPKCPGDTVAIGRRCEPAVSDSSTASRTADSGVPDAASVSEIDDAPRLDGSAQADVDAGSSGEASECTSDAECSDRADAAPSFCVSNMCVACRTNEDCTELGAPECNAGVCVGCSSHDACEGREGTEVCVTAGGPKHGRCVTCFEHSDCKAPEAPQCTSYNACVPCAGHAACESRDGTERCNVRPDAATVGRCVKCTGVTESEDCGGTSCDQSTGQCTDVAVGDLAPCNRCVADSQCISGSKCVKHTRNGTDLGYFCFNTVEAHGGCADTVASARPYSVRETATSIDGSERDYCLPVTSCQALDDASTSLSQGTVECSVDDDCGIAGSNDGACGPDDRCTYVCDDPVECASDIPSCKVAESTGPKLCLRGG